MTDILKSMGAVMPTTAGDLYTSPVSVTSIILAGSVHNPTAGTVQLDLKIAKHGGGDVILAQGVDIAAGGFFQIPGKLTLESEDVLNGSCSASGCFLSMSYDEHGDVAVDIGVATQAALDAAGYRDDAANQVTLAAAQVTLAQGKVDDAQAQATAAASSATDAASAALKELKVNNLGQVGTNQNLDCSQYNHFVLEPTANITLTFTNVSIGTAGIVSMVGGGDVTVTFAGPTLKWVTSDGLPPTFAAGSLVTSLSYLDYGTGTALKLKRIVNEEV